MINNNFSNNQYITSFSSFFSWTFDRRENVRVLNEKLDINIKFVPYLKALYRKFLKSNFNLRLDRIVVTQTARFECYIYKHCGFGNDYE